MKILAICNAIDLRLRQGCTPAWWQLFKGLCESGCEIIVVPFLGRSIESLWWRDYANPYSGLINVYQSLARVLPTLHMTARRSENPGNNLQSLNRSWRKYAYNTISRKWKNYVFKILEKEKNVDYVVIFNIPLIMFGDDFIDLIRNRFDLRVVFYDGDGPVSLPKYWSPSRTPFNLYFGADLSSLDGVITNSKGAVSDLRELGATSVEVIYYGADPQFYSPIDVKKNIDIFFYGHGEEFREKWLSAMISYPSCLLRGIRFVIGGRMKIDLGKAKSLGYIPIGAWRLLCCRSKINLNITREQHAAVLASSTARLFELSSLGCCVVSNPINGLEEWFKRNKEVFVATSKEDAAELYKWLLSSDDLILKTGSSARRRVLKEHTFSHRAEQMIRFLRHLR